MGRSKSKGNSKLKKKRQNKTTLIFDEEKRREFLSGFHKRKLQRKKEAKEKLARDLKLEQKRIKAEAKESFKKLVQSRKPIPELEDLLKEEYEDEEVTVKVLELSTNDVALKNNWIGANQPPPTTTTKLKQKRSDDADGGVKGMELEGEEENDDDDDKGEEVKQQEFKSEKDVKRLLKKKATRNVKKSQVFKMKNRVERQKQKKKSFQIKKQNQKIKQQSQKRR